MLRTMPVSQASYLWPEPMETVSRLVGVGPSVPGLKTPHLTLVDQLFIGAVANTPRAVRPWGAITWLSEWFHISRPTVYALGERLADDRLAAPKDERASSTTVPETRRRESPLPIKTVTVTPNRIARTVLTMALPGKVALRPMQDCLGTAFDQTRGVGTLSELLLDAGKRAGAVLGQIDQHPLGSAILLRDETYFQDWPILLVVEPVSTVIVLGVVAPDCQAETWGATLLVAQDRGADIGGLVEDMARIYPKSQQLAENDAEVQKDTWHVEHPARSGATGIGCHPPGIRLAGSSG
jgi:hypothetical protein